MAKDFLFGIFGDECVSRCHPVGDEIPVAQTGSLGVGIGNSL